ncbi:hypothetical protein VTN31DRAFT_6626 [Thermomyces dupontii]|uniref:uncharacterized protein n=1 Tax=Talaromyces thermophilus TaxID=28565 RepID=UPI003743F1D4
MFSIKQVSSSSKAGVFSREREREKRKLRARCWIKKYGMAWDRAPLCSCLGWPDISGGFCCHSSLFGKTEDSTSSLVLLKFLLEMARIDWFFLSWRFHFLGSNVKLFWKGAFHSGLVCWGEGSDWMIQVNPRSGDLDSVFFLPLILESGTGRRWNDEGSSRLLQDGVCT